ncbi:hypothetical protein BDV98DRAFT_104384 [Pterulicium gracile]|uniref:Uncharacterized protein n=1 Tax=Pterulicium gracile TaxID=1884261 RepID=A0A5C3QFP4_9AGAR|nr:hypothetical protein BDV98DRAFT_104384 [Pterula gracilis]
MLTRRSSCLAATFKVEHRRTYYDRVYGLRGCTNDHDECLVCVLPGVYLVYTLGNKSMGREWWEDARRLEYRYTPRVVVNQAGDTSGSARCCRRRVSLLVCKA